MTHEEALRELVDSIEAFDLSDPGTVTRDKAWMRRKDAFDSAKATLAAPAQAEPVAWQPIETAPKDGTLIWLGKPYNLRLGRWSSHAQQWIDSARAENAGGPRGLLFEPTSWQNIPAAPLPSPPTSGEGK